MTSFGRSVYVTASPDLFGGLPTAAVRGSRGERFMADVVLFGFLLVLLDRLPFGLALEVAAGRTVAFGKTVLLVSSPVEF